MYKIVLLCTDLFRTDLLILIAIQFDTQILVIASHWFFAKWFIQNSTSGSTYDQLHNGRRTYRYFQGDPLYPFGYGLSYTTFMYSDLKLTSSAIQVGQPIGIQVIIQNAGPVSADEVGYKLEIIC